MAVSPCGCLRSSISTTSSRSNQRASSSSLRSTVIFVRQCLGMTADHQRHRERPRLRREIIDAAAARCRLPRSTSRRTASSIVSPGSMKPARHDHMVGRKRGERPSTQRSPAIASMITTGSVRGKCCALQDGQSRRQPPRTGLRRRAAIRTEAMPRMPAKQRLGFGERRQMLGIDQALHRDAAQIGELEVAARLQRFDGAGIKTEAESRRADPSGRGTRSRARRRTRAPLRP